MFYWNPPREIFHVPYIDRPVMWYGLLFVLGFVVGYWIVIPMLMTVLQDSQCQESDLRAASRRLADRLMWFVIVGAVVGARLGHVFFYAWPMYKNHPLDILKTWEGGLASHGGVAGILIGLFLFRLTISKLYPKLTFVKLIDILTIPASLGGCFIRLGNFVNQEILGTETSVPWAVVFGDPADGSFPVPRHPVQLYEAGANLLIFFFLWVLWRFPAIRLKTGLIAGIFFILNFGSRIVLEFFKEQQQSLMIDESWLTMGQWLSIPLVVLGGILCLYALLQNRFQKNTF